MYIPKLFLFLIEQSMGHAHIASACYIRNDRFYLFIFRCGHIKMTYGGNGGESVKTSLLVCVRMYIFVCIYVCTYSVCMYIWCTHEHTDMHVSMYVCKRECSGFVCT